MTFRQLSMRSGELPSTSGNYSCSCETFHQLSSTLLKVGRHSVNICQISVRPRDLPSRSIKFCVAGRSSGNFGQLSERPVDLPSIFHVAGRPSINFCQLSVQPGDLPQISTNFLFHPRTSTFHDVGKLFIFPCGRETFYQLQSTLHAAGRSSISFCLLPLQTEDLPSTFRMARGTSVNFRLPILWPKGLPSTSVNFRVARRPSINFRQISMWPEEF